MTGTDALDGEAGRALAGEVTDLLEAELVRFVHRVAHEHGIDLDRARAAMVLLGIMVASGVPWTAHSDSAPARIAAAFRTLEARAPAWPDELAASIHAEVTVFVTATAAIEIADLESDTIAGRLRRAGAEPAAWWWAAELGDDVARAWQACADHADRTVEIALALGVPGEVVARALARAFGVASARVRTGRTAQRADLVALLDRLAAKGVAALGAERELIGKATALAFEMAAAHEPWSTPETRRAARDGIAELAVLSFQLVELFQALKGGRPPDLERFAGVAARAERALVARGLRLAGLLQRELEGTLPAPTGRADTV